MIVKQYIKDFEKLGFGMFVHFGLYSKFGKGEWAKKLYPDYEDYEKLADTFCPEPDWAEKLVDTAKSAGCKYITLTTRHHDGYALFDTCGLSDYDAVHTAPGRDLVREFVDACRNAGITPFFYHTIIDWHDERFARDDMEKYLEYLRANVEVLCTRYGKIGGLWFDGMWAKKDYDWEQDELYKVIRKHQPDCMIINNTGLDARGALGHIELDSVTFERGRPKPINTPDAPKYIASEMCQILNSHWGYAERDFTYSSMKDIIEDFCVCRRYGSNFLLNVGPMGNGYVRRIDDAMLRLLGEWVELHEEALYIPRPAGIEVSRDKDFLLRDGKTLYYFAHDLPVRGDVNVTPGGKEGELISSFALDGEIESASWLCDGTPVDFDTEGGKTRLLLKPQRYGNDLVVKVCKIILK